MIRKLFSTAVATGQDFWSGLDAIWQIGIAVAGILAALFFLRSCVRHHKEVRRRKGRPCTRGGMAPPSKLMIGLYR